MTNIDVVYGYGVDGNDLINIDDEKLLLFFKKYLPSDYSDMEEDISLGLATDTEEWLDNYECYNTCHCGKYAIIANAINENSELSFEYHSSEDKEAVILVEKQPWQYTEKERNLTREGLDALLKAYFAELDVDVCPSHYSIEYCG